MHITLFASFVIIAAILLVGSHYYVYRRLIKSSVLPARLHRLLTIILLLLAGLIPGVFIASRLIPREILGSVSLLAYFWLGTLFYLLIFLITWDSVRGITWSVKKIRKKRQTDTDKPSNETRRMFLQRVGAGACMMASTAVTGFGIRGAFAHPQTPEIPVRLKKLPPALSGFRIALLSDLHIGPVLDKDFLAAMVRKTNSLRPDLIAITGDLVDMPVEKLSDQIVVIKDLHAPHGVFFTTGNHEYFFGAAQWIEFIKSLGIKVLANELVTIGKGDTCFELAGIHDFSGGWFDPTLAPDPDKAMAQHDPKNELVLLAHQPKQIQHAVSHKVGLQLSGHTHGGQIWPFGLLTQLDQPYLSGLHRHNETTQIFVTRGVGFWGPPMRVGAPSEIPVIVLSS